MSNYMGLNILCCICIMGYRASDLLHSMGVDYHTTRPLRHAQHLLATTKKVTSPPSLTWPTCHQDTAGTDPVTSGWFVKL